MKSKRLWAARRRSLSGRPMCSVRIGGILLCLIFLFDSCLPAQTPDTGTKLVDGPYNTLLESAQSHISAQRYAEAEAELVAAVSLSPRRAEGWIQLGLLYDRIHDFKSAEDSLRRSLQLDPGQANAHYLLGLTLIANPGESLDWPAAIGEFREAIQLKPDDTDAMDRLGAGLLEVGQTDEAVSVLEHAAMLAPGKAGTQFDLGLALEAKGDRAGAAEHYRLALKAQPEYGEVDSALGKVMLTQGSLDEAERCLREALRLNPDLQDAHYALASVLRKQKRTAEAQQEFDETAALAQRAPDATSSSQLSNGALAKAAAGDLAGAEADLRKAVRLRADYAVPHYNLGLILADERHMVEAERQLSVAISLMPGRAQLWVDLAKVQARLGELAAARGSIAFALQLAPASQSAQREAEALKTGQSVGPAATGLHPRIALLLGNDDTAQAHAERASALQSESDWTDAAGEWLRVLSLEPAGEAPRLELAKCLQNLNDSAGSILEERKILLINPKSVRAHIALAESLVSAGSLQQAREELDLALRLDPDSTSAKAALERLRTP